MNTLVCLRLIVQPITATPVILANQLWMVGGLVVASAPTRGWWWTSGSIWGLLKGNRHSRSPGRSKNSWPSAMWMVFFFTTSLVMKGAAVSRSVSSKALSGERNVHISASAAAAAAPPLHYSQGSAWSFLITRCDGLATG